MLIFNLSVEAQGTMLPPSLTSKTKLSNSSAPLQNDSITKEDIFHYIYALLHHPLYGSVTPTT